LQPQAGPGKNMRPYPKNKLRAKDEAMAQVVFLASTRPVSSSVVHHGSPEHCRRSCSVV
jgi:hypothetical protein